MIRRIILALTAVAAGVLPLVAQLNTDQVMLIGRNTLYFEDYVLSIQYFNQVIAVKPYLAQPYFYRAIAKLNLDDYRGAEADATLAIERNPFITDAWEVRGVARQNLGDLHGAVADYDKALESLPDNRSLLYNRAMALEELKDYDEARRSLNNLIRSNPGFEPAYVGRARLNSVTGDTIAAVADVEKALELNPSSINARLIHSDLMMTFGNDPQAALADMDEAIRLRPQMSGLFINRAFIRYKLDDYYGAMADYDYAVTLEPTNVTALYNRALLRAEVHDLNRAAADFDKVLELDPDNYRALFNRAVIRRDLGDLNGAVADLDRLIEVFPEFSAAWFMRFDVRRTRGDRGAQADYNKSIALATKNVAAKDNPLDLDPAATGQAEETQEQVKARFSTLLTVADTSTPEETYNSKEIKGRVQDRRMPVELEPMLSLTYYTSPTEIKPGGEYIREVADANESRMLRFLLQASIHPARATDEDVFDTHTRSIDLYTSWLSTHSPRAIDYLGRAMDYMTLRNYDAAEADLTRALELSPDYTLALFARAQARFLKADIDQTDTPRRIAVQSAVADLDEVLRLSPRMSAAWYNKGVILGSSGDFTSAISAFTRAIELNPDLGEAWYNRGYAYLRLGNREAGLADLSKAGELGVVPSYNLLKRMSVK